MPRTLKDFKDAYDILVKYAGANESERNGFLTAHNPHPTNRYPCQEWRFCGHLGFGGKFRSATFRIDCYKEDHNEHRDTIIRIVNKALGLIGVQRTHFVGDDCDPPHEELKP